MTDNASVPTGGEDLTATPHAGTGRGLSVRVARAILLILTALAFVVAFRASLFWDDFIVIGPGKPIASPATILHAFSQRCALFPPSYQYPYYRPLVDISFVLDYLVGGAHPLVYHLTNYALHLANVALAFALFLRLLGDEPGRGERPWAAGEETPPAIPRSTVPKAAIAAGLLGAGVFALHPIQCESVLWAASRPAMMSVFFGQLGAFAALHFVRRASQSVVRTALLVAGAALAFIAALLSKEVAVTFVPAAVVFFLVKRRRASRRAVALYALLILILAAYIVANRLETSYVGGTLSTRLERLADLSISSLGFYVRQLSFPLALYPYYMPASASGPWYFAVGATAVAGIGIAAVFLLLRRTPLAMTGLFGLILFLGGAWLPMFGGQAVLADRYLYQAMWGLGLAVAAGFAALARRFAWPPRHFALGAGLALCLLAALSLRQSAFWIREDVMWSHTVELDPGNLHGNFYLGQYFESHGDLDRAETHYRMAAYEAAAGRLADRCDAAMALGHLLLERRRYDEALAAYAWAARNPEYRNDAIVCQAIVDFERQAPDRAWQRLRSFHDDGKEKAATCLNLALIALRKANDLKTTAEWYEKARARGAAPNAEIEAALHSAKSTRKTLPGDSSQKTP